MNHIILKFSYILLTVGCLISCKEGQNKIRESNKPIDQNERVDESNNKKTILFYGNSLTAGYGLETNEAFPALIQDRIDSLQLKYTVINSGLSGETTSGGLNRLTWVLNQDIDIFILELGANDGLRGIPLKETRQNLHTIIRKVKEKNSATKIILAGMQIPPNMGKDYTAEFQKIYPELAEEHQIDLIPFLLEGVAGKPSLNLEDGSHPSAEGQKIVMENVWEVLKDNLNTTDAI